jgi:hypothetical protein
LLVSLHFLLFHLLLSLYWHLSIKKRNQKNLVNMATITSFIIKSQLELGPMFPPPFSKFKIAALVGVGAA